MEGKKTCDTCFWSSLEGFCTEGGRPPRRPKEPCDKYKPIKNIADK